VWAAQRDALELSDSDEAAAAFLGVGAAFLGVGAAAPGAFEVSVAANRIAKHVNANTTTSTTWRGESEVGE